MKLFFLLLIYLTLGFSSVVEKDADIQEFMKLYMDTREQYIVDYKDNVRYKWEVTEYDSYIKVAINGNYQHGSKLSFYLIGDYCESTESSFTMYTIANKEDVFDLNGKEFFVLANGQKMIAKINGIQDFALGHLISFSFGVHDIDYTLKYFNQFRNFEIKVLDSKSDSELFKGDEYFDINHNNWSMDNLNKSLNEAQELCILKRGK